LTVKRGIESCAAGQSFACCRIQIGMAAAFGNKTVADFSFWRNGQTESRYALPFFP
jgi:hypothetical protein